MAKSWYFGSDTNRTQEVSDHEKSTLTQIIEMQGTRPSSHIWRREDKTFENSILSNNPTL
jgi:hypothetical protein